MNDFLPFFFSQIEATTEDAVLLLHHSEIIAKKARFVEVVEGVVKQSAGGFKGKCAESMF